MSLQHLTLALALALSLPVLAAPPLTAPGRMKPEGDSGTTDLIIPITLSDAVSRPQTIEVWTAPDSATEWEDYEPVYRSLTFGPGETEKQVAIRIVGDALYEPREVFHLYFGSSTLGWYSALAGIDNDDPIPVLSIEDVTVTEGQTATLFVRSTQPITGSVSYRAISGSASAGEDFVGTDGTLAFNKETTKTIEVAIKADAATELDEQLSMRLSIAGTSPFQLQRELATIHILDDDPGIGPAELQLASGTSRRAIVRIASASGTSTIIDLASSASDAVSTPSSVTIPAGSKTATFDIHASIPNRRETIAATFPNGSTAKMNVITFGGAQLIVTPQILQMNTGQTVAIRASLQPPSPQAVTVGIADNDTVDTPWSFVIPAGGEGSFEVKAVKTGAIVITLVLPQELGGQTIGISGSVGLVVQPKLHGITPSSGPTAGGTEITISGTGLRRECFVQIAGSRADPQQYIDGSTIKARTPPLAEGSYNVLLRCGTNAADVLYQAFRYIDTAPVAKNVEPRSGTMSGGTHVRVTGTALDPSCWVYFGDKAATQNRVHDATTITAVAPPHAAGVADVRVRCDGGIESTLPRIFTFDPRPDPMPTLEGFTPNAVAPGETLRIAGVHYRLTDTFTIDGIVPQVLEALPDSRIVVVPDVPQGDARIAIKRDGATIAATFAVRKATPPRATYVSHDELPANAELEIRGLGFRNGYTFALGETTLRTIAQTPTVAVVRIPAHAIAGTYDLEVRDAANLPVSYGPQVTVTESGLAIDAVTERCATTTGGIEVTITGTGFVHGAEVWFGDVRSTELAYVDANTIRARVPAHVPGNATITVVANDVETTLTNAFRFVSPHDPRGCSDAKRTRAVRH